LKLIHIRRAEDNPALFQPPPDYAIVNDEGSVTLNLKRRKSWSCVVRLAASTTSLKEPHSTIETPISEWSAPFWSAAGLLCLVRNA
jgi:hypothetical protein